MRRKNWSLGKFKITIRSSTSKTLKVQGGIVSVVSSLIRKTHSKLVIYSFKTVTGGQHFCEQIGKPGAG
jgi:hypothetical protein